MNLWLTANISSTVDELARQLGVGLHS